MVDGEENRERSWQLTEESYKVSIRVAAPIYDAMLRVLDSGVYFNVQDYIKDVIRRDLEARDIRMDDKT